MHQSKTFSTNSIPNIYELPFVNIGTLRKLQSREQLTRELAEVAIRHARNVIHYGLIFIVLPGIGAIVVGKLLLDARNVVLKDVRGLVTTV